MAMNRPDTPLAPTPDPEIVKGNRPGIGQFKTVKEKTTVGGIVEPYKYTRTSIDTAGYSKGKKDFELKTQKGTGDKASGITVKSNKSKTISRKDVPSALKSLK
jgi:hypothetical protein